MTPLFACFPVVMTFAALTFLFLIVIATGMANDVDQDKQPENAPAVPSRVGATGPPPWWVVVLIFASVAALMLVLAWFFPE